MSLYNDAGEFQGLLGLRGKRLSGQREAQAKGYRDVLAASGVNTRAIPGIGQALAGTEGQAVTQALLGNAAVSPQAAETERRQGLLDDRQQLLWGREDTLWQQAQADRLAARNAPQQMLSKPSFNDLVNLQESVTGISQGIADVQTLSGLLDSYPTWYDLAANPAARGTAAQAMTGAAAAMNQILDLGALTSDEREFLFDMQQNPDSVLSRLTGNDSRTQALYSGLIQRMERRRSALEGLSNRAGYGQYIDFGSINSPFTVPTNAGPPVAPVSGVERANKQTPEAIIKPGTSIF